MNNPDQKTAAEVKKEDTLQSANEYADTSEEYAAYQKSYIKLRTHLDSLQATALRYVLSDKDLAGQTKRAEEVASRAMAFMAEMPGAVPSPEGGCGDGYYNCGGVCVPYPCPFAAVE